MRSVLFTSQYAARFVLAVVAMAVLLSLLPHSAAATSIGLDSIANASLGSTVTVAITATDVDPAHEFAGFDLLIAYDGVLAQFNEAQPGQILTDCGWEYFSYRFESSGQVRIVALAETNNGDVHPSCFVDGAGVLAELGFTVSSNPDHHCYLLPVRFLWTDCSDNVFASVTGDSIYLSDQVYDFGNNITVNENFPTYGGANDDCLAGANTFRGIDFYNGGIELSCDSTPANNPRITLDWNVSAPIGEVMPVSVYFKDFTAFEAGGFDLLVGYNPQFITALNAVPGDLLTNCGWEYFTYLVSDLPECDGVECPEAAIRLVAVAETNNGPNHPSCFAADSGQLASINFVSTGDTSQVGVWQPLSFVWRDCGDNALASVSGDSLYLSRNVYDAGGLPMPVDDLFPTMAGALDECLVEGMALYRAVDYYGGRYRLTPAPPLDYRGDLNLNGIANELADYDLYVLYFIYGLSAFQVNVEAQVAASDVNADGLTLTLSDLLYLFRVIVGDVMPNPVSGTAPLDTVVLVQDTAARTISLASYINVSALYLAFDNDVLGVSTELGTHQLTYGPDSADTRALLMPSFGDFMGIQPLPTGVILSYNYPANVVYAIGTWDGTMAVPIRVEQVQGGCCLVRGNIDHSVNGEINISDLIYLVQYAFNGGPEIPCMDEADVNNNDVPAEISDLVYLVNYMFVSGPTPVPCD